MYARKPFSSKELYGWMLVPEQEKSGLFQSKIKLKTTVGMHTNLLNKPGYLLFQNSAPRRSYPCEIIMQPSTKNTKKCS